MAPAQRTWPTEFKRVFSGSALAAALQPPPPPANQAKHRPPSPGKGKSQTRPEYDNRSHLLAKSESLARPANQWSCAQAAAPLSRRMVGMPKDQPIGLAARLASPKAADLNSSSRAMAYEAPAA